MANKKAVREAKVPKSPRRPKRNDRDRRGQGTRKPAPKRRTGTDEATVDEAGDLAGDAPEFSVVGMGASAGGLEAFTKVLDALPAETGLAIVLVQHLAPNHESVLPELLSPHSKLPLVQVRDGMELEPDHVYVIPPNTLMAVEGRSLRLSPREAAHGPNMPIDYFFRSIAEVAQNRAIGVVLSGSASDGTQGLREIKAVGGIAIVQDPATARFDGMPRAAIDTRVVDLVLPPEQIAAELVRLGSQMIVRTVRPTRPGDGLPVGDDHLQQIFKALRNATGVDFSQYKQPTIRRRLQRRMVLQKISDIEHYLKFLEEHPAEVQSLYNDVLISVTRFFREPESFEALAEIAFPRIVESRRNNSPLRIWVPGCATGEEPYSVAIALLEFLGDNAGAVPVQIFATDIHDTAVEKARGGAYPESISADISPERLRRFFTRADGGYRINKMIRDLCVFARQDVTRDPPFSKLDLIVCRNVLIYLGPTLQRKMMSIFHYALKPSGFLMLGSAETVGPHAELFAVADKKHRLYTRKSAETEAPLSFPMAPAARPGRRGPQPRPELREGITLQAEANRIIMERYAPPGVVVDGEFQIVQFRGQTGLYLEPAPGDASLSILKMAREGLLHGLRSALQTAVSSGKPARKEGLHIQFNGHGRDVNVEVVPMKTDAGHHYLVVFEDVTPPERLSKGARPPKRRRRNEPPPARDDDLERLQQELAASREYLQSTIHELEAANEELQSANEEILSSNEELQSTNEELDTAKEELQSTNEELNTLNEELHGRNEELTRVNSDLINLLANVQIAIVMVDGGLRIRRFTPMAERVLNLIPTDVGRPISHVKPNINCPELEQLIAEAVDGVTSKEREVRDPQGNRFSLRIRPYKSIDNRIDGAVLALFEVGEKRMEAGE